MFGEKCQSRDTNFSYCFSMIEKDTNSIDVEKITFSAEKTCMQTKLYFPRWKFPYQSDTTLNGVTRIPVIHSYRQIVCGASSDRHKGTTGGPSDGDKNMKKVFSTR